MTSAWLAWRTQYKAACRVVCLMHFLSKFIFHACRWSDTGARQPYAFGNDPSRAGYCRSRLATMAARYIQFATNEYTLYGGQTSPRDTFMCPELLNTIVVRCVCGNQECVLGAELPDILTGPMPCCAPLIL